MAVVSQAFARKHWGDTSPLGHRVTFGGEEDWMEIVGVSGNVRHFSFDRAPRPEVYVSYMRDPWPFFSLVVKTSLDPSALVEPVYPIATIILIMPGVSGTFFFHPIFMIYLSV